MTNAVLLIISSIIAALLFIFFIVTGIIRRSLYRILFSVLFLLIAGGSLFLLAVYGTIKASSKVAQSIDAVKQKFKPRTGAEIYHALFSMPVDTCVKVINQQDQVVPRLDCCIWLEFKVCSKELNKIIIQQKLKTTNYNSADTINYIPDFSQMPLWWTPQLLDDSVFVSRSDFDNPNRVKILIFAKDSSHAFYCDMAD